MKKPIPENSKIIVQNRMLVILFKSVWYVADNVNIVNNIPGIAEYRKSFDLIVVINLSLWNFEKTKNKTINIIMEMGFRVFMLVKRISANNAK